MTEADPVPEPETLLDRGGETDVSGALEALLLLAEEPLPEMVLAQAIGVPVSTVADCLAELVAFYDETGRGFELRHLGGGWRYYTREEHVEVVSAFVLEGQQSKLSQASLETLAVVAYQQPISRARISAVRGVNVDGVIRTLAARGLLEEAGTDDESGAVVFATTTYFLERMGLASLADLPDLAPHLPDVDELEAELSQLAVVVPDARRSDPSAPETSPAEHHPDDDDHHRHDDHRGGPEPDQTTEHDQPDHGREGHDHVNEDER